METDFKKVFYGIIVPMLISLRVRFWPNINGLKNIDSPSKTFFILGSGRNGSTLLALLLNRQEDAFLPPEQYALPYFINSWYLNVFRSWESHCKKWVELNHLKNLDWALDLNDYSKLEAEMAQLPMEQRKPSNLFLLLLKRYAEKLGKSAAFVGDHSPISTLFHKVIFREFPKANYVMMVRNPMDVVLSYSKISENPASDPVYACWKWNQSIETYHWLKEKGANVHLVRYEDLVSKPDLTVRKVVEFLGMGERNIDTSTLDSSADILGVKNYSYHDKLYKPITTDSIGKWKAELSQEVIDKVVPLVKANATKFQYELE